MAMIKKLQLSEFLIDSASVVEATPVVYRQVERELTYPLVEFYTRVIQQTNGYYVDGIFYSSLIPSTNNLYFFNEASNEEFILIFDPIIDIKNKNGIFTVFYYPNTTINIAFKDINA